MRDQELVRQADRVLREVLQGLPDFRVTSRREPKQHRRQSDLIVDAVSKSARFRFFVEVKSRVTPQTALFLCDQFPKLHARAIPVVYAPTISPRVSEILRAAHIGYVDRAGNCWLQSSRDHLLIERQGFASERRRTPAAADPFSPKSSRIVRLLLTEPQKGWQVRELAGHPDVEVSPGLVVKVKRALLEEGYAVERDRLLFLRDPKGLLGAWSQKYSGPAEQLPLYFRGEAATAEREVHRWCRDHSLQHALAGFSAAWRLAPEVRYSAATVYVEERGLSGPLLDQLCAKLGAKQVSTGPNLFLWRPFDHSVFSGSAPAGRSGEPVTSPLQTYLDATRTPGRGEEAADAIFQKHLHQDFDLVAQREEEKRRATV